MSEEEKNNEEVLMHFVIPYNWKSVLRGLFWINIGLIVGVTLSLFFLTMIGELSLKDPQAQICMAGGYIIFIAIYLLIRYVTIHEDKIKEPIRVWIKKDCFIFKSNREFVGRFENIRKAEVIINDKITKLETWYYYPNRKGDTGWIYGLKRGDVEKGKYKYYIEKYWIPSMKLIIERIKEMNPNVEVIWRDERRKYK